MKKPTDHKIKKMLSEQAQDQPTMSESDLQMYSLLFEVLQQPSTEGLPMSFANKVSRLGVVQAEQRQRKRVLLFQLLALSFSLPLSLVILFYYQPTITANLLDYFQSGQWIIVFSILMFVAIQLADFVLLRRKSAIPI